MADTSDQLELAQLKQNMWMQDMYLMIRTVIEPSKMPLNALAHTKWVIATEKQGKIFASGPVFNRDGKPGKGQTVFKAASYEEAEAIANTDPFVTSGAVEYSMTVWQVSAGRMSLDLDFSDMTFTSK